MSSGSRFAANHLIFGPPWRQLLLLVAWSGCALLREPAELLYRTVPETPHRDTQEARTLTAQAVRLAEKGRLDRAEEVFQKALIADVSYGPAHNNLGSLYFQQGKYYLAAWEYEYASRLMPDRAEPLNNLGLVYEAAGKLQEAIAVYQSAVSMDGTHPEFLGNLARAKLRRGDKDDEARWILEELMLYETRHDWRGWAEEQLASIGRIGDTSTTAEADKGAATSQPSQQPTPAEELSTPTLEIPAPVPQIPAMAPEPSPPVTE